MLEVKVTQIGNSLGIILPKDVISRLGVGKGQTVFLILEQDGVCITPLDPRIANQIAMAEEITNRYRNALKKLAE